MFTHNKGKLNKLISSLMNSYGSVSIYVDKNKSNNSKNRTAVSIINDSIHSIDFTNTIIQCVDSTIQGRKDEESMVNMDFTVKKKETLVSNRVMSYESCLATIYKLRLDGMIISDIANVKDCESFEFISVEEIDNYSDILKISHSNNGVYLKQLDKELASIVDDNSAKRLKEIHNSSIIDVRIADDNINSLLSIIEIAFNKTFYTEYKYTIQSNKYKNLSVLSANKVSCVIEDNRITLTDFGRFEGTDNFREVLGRILGRYNYDYSIKSTGNIAML